LGKEFGCKPLYIIPFRKLGQILIISLIAALAASSVLLFNFPSLVELSVGAIIFGVLYLVISYLKIPEFKETIYDVLIKSFKKPDN
jgi:hypothetical protein